MLYLACIFAYLLLLAAIGVAQSRRVKSQADFAVAGRSLSPWVMVCTMLAVWIGTGSIVGNAEQTYEAGTAVSLIWSEAAFIRDALPGSVSGLDAVLPAITTSVVCLVVVSLLTKNPQAPHNAANGQQSG